EGWPDTEAAGDDRPPPSRAEGRDEHDGRGRQKRAAVDRLEAGEEGTGAETPDHDRERCHRDRRTRPPTDASHGNTSRSAWPTVTVRRPPAASLRRRRR